MTFTKQIRKTIREYAASRDCKFRITANGEVHFYGTMPNTNQTGWYFVGFDAAEIADDRAAGER